MRRYAFGIVGTALALVVLIAGLIEIHRFAHVNEPVFLIVVGAGGAGLRHLRQGALDAGDHPVKRGDILAQVPGLGKYRLYRTIHRGVDLDRIQRKQRVALGHRIAAFQIKGQQHAGIGRSDLVDVFALRHRVGGDVAHGCRLHILRKGAQGRQQSDRQQQGDKFFHG